MPEGKISALSKNFGRAQGDFLYKILFYSRILGGYFLKKLTNIEENIVKSLRR